MRRKRDAPQTYLPETSHRSPPKASGKVSDKKNRTFWAGTRLDGGGAARAVITERIGGRDSCLFVLF